MSGAPTPEKKLVGAKSTEPKQVYVGDPEDAYGRTLAYVYLDTNNHGSFEHPFNEDLLDLGLARTTTAASLSSSGRRPKRGVPVSGMPAL